MSDPLYQRQEDEKRLDEKRLAADPRAVAAFRRMQWLRLATGLLALSIIAAIWIIWRWTGPS